MNQHYKITITRLLFLLVLVLSGAAASAQTIRYVKPTSTGTGDGSSWANASSNLEHMIQLSQFGDQVWVAKGTFTAKRRPGYTDTAPQSKDRAFLLKSGVKMYGSFAGNESGIEERDIKLNATVLSADFNGDDVEVSVANLSNTTLAKNGENGYHVVVGCYLHKTTIFDGFTLVGGNASSSSSFTIPGAGVVSRSSGGGIALLSPEGQFSNLIIKNCYANGSGGAMGMNLLIEDHPRAVNLSIFNCASGSYGSAIYVGGTSHSAVPEFFNMLVYNCYGTNAISVTTASAYISNATIYGISGSGSAFNSVLRTADEAQVALYNSIIGYHDQFKWYRNTNTITPLYATDNILYGTTEGQFSGYGNINNVANAGFVDAANGNFQLLGSSPAVNSGLNSRLITTNGAARGYAAITTDLAGNARIYNNTVDIGAYEYSAPSCITPAPPTAEDQALCTISNPTVASLTAEGTNLKWYSAATGGSPLAADEEVTAGTYYVSQSNGTCESARTAVEVTLASNCITLDGPYCNITTSFSKPLYAVYVPGATQYRFRVQDGSNVQVIERNVRYFYVNNIDGYNYDKQYSVSVSYLKDGQWSTYGPACTVSTPPPGLSQLRPEYCGIAVSSFASAIYASHLPMATGYRFRITEGGNTQVIEKTVGYFRINEITGYTYGKTYTIDVATHINGQWGAYGPACTITTSQAVTHLADGYCGITTQSLKTVIYAKGVSQATGYRFRINDGATDHVLTRPKRYFMINQIPGYTYNTTYTVNVAALINGSWTDYGPACTITTPIVQLTQIVAAQCGSTVSSLATNIRIGSVSRVEGYRLRVTDGQQEQILDRPSASFRLNMLPSRAYNVTYTVEVAVLVNGEYEPFGPACTITAVNNVGRLGSDDDFAVEAEAEITDVTAAIWVTSYPNPYTESFTVEMNTPSREKVIVRAFDMNGRLVEDITVSPEELTSQKLGDGYSAGIYSVIVSQGEYQKAFKVVKK